MRRWTEKGLFGEAVSIELAKDTRASVGAHMLAGADVDWSVRVLRTMTFRAREEDQSQIGLSGYSRVALSGTRICGLSAKRLDVPIRGYVSGVREEAEQSRRDAVDQRNQRFDEAVHLSIILSSAVELSWARSLREEMRVKDLARSRETE